MSLDYLYPKSMPAELKRFRFWMAERYEEKHKVPVDPVTLRKANWKNPEIWRSFDEALQIARDNGLDGIGIVLSEHDPFCAFDFDACINLAIRELHPVAAKIVNQLGSYSEYSPSWSGLRVIAKGEKPSGFKQKNAAMPWGDELAVYDHNQFVTVTGNTFGDSFINERQEEIAAVCGEYLPRESVENGAQLPARERFEGTDTKLLQAACRNASTGEAVRNLYAGNYQGYTSESEAEFRLAKELAEYDPDPDRIERMLLDSGLPRPKRESPKTLRHTVEKAIAERTGFYDPAYIKTKKLEVCELVESCKKDIDGWMDKKYTEKAQFILGYFKGGWMNDDGSVTYSVGDRRIAKDSKDTPVEMSQSTVSRVFGWLEDHGVLTMDEYDGKQKINRRSAAYRLTPRES